MALRWRVIAATLTVLAIAVVYPLYIHDLLFVSYGLGREVQAISEFPYQCRRLSDPGLEACEDMWLSEGTRQLLLACSEPLSRRQWMPK